MKELDKVIIDAIQKTQDGIGKAVDFAIEQAPEVIQQLLLWNAIKSAIFFTVWVLCFLGCLAIGFYFSKIYNEKFYILISLEVAVFPFSLSLVCLDWLKIMIAPKLYLLEYAASLAK